MKAIQLTDNSDSGKLCGAAAVSPSPLLTASPTPYHTTPLSRFSGPVWNLSMYMLERWGTPLSQCWRHLIR
ncbi:hypothetical protein J6590_089311 [Homalodisca vitripennis]|nr:hypothetical protein J6590_089311 [Homalodisca vitripennis]